MIAPGVERDSRYTAPMPALTLVSAMTLSTAAIAVVSVTVESGKVRRIIVVVQGGGTSLGGSVSNVKRCSVVGSGKWAVRGEHGYGHLQSPPTTDRLPPTTHVRSNSSILSAILSASGNTASSSDG